MKHKVDLAKQYKHLRGRHDQRDHNRWPAGYQAQTYTPSGRRGSAIAARATGGLAGVTQENILANQGEVQGDMFAGIPSRQFETATSIRAVRQDSLVFGAIKLFKDAISSSTSKYKSENKETIAGVVIQQYSAEEQLDIIRRLSELEANNYNVPDDAFSTYRQSTMRGDYYEIWKAIGVFGHPEARLEAYKATQEQMKLRKASELSNKIPYISEIVSKYDIELSDEFSEIITNGIENSFSDDYQNAMNTVKNQITQIKDALEYDVAYDIRAKILQLRKQADAIKSNPSIPDSDKNRQIADILDERDVEIENLDNLQKEMSDFEQQTNDILYYTPDGSFNDIAEHLERNSLEYLIANIDESQTRQAQIDNILYQIMNAHRDGVDEGAFSGGVTPLWAAHMQQLFGKIGPNTEYPIDVMPSFFYKPIKTPEPHPLLVKFLNEAYDARQKKFKQENVSHFKLYRGRRPGSPPRGIPMEPWSSDKRTAEGFGSIDTEPKMDVRYILHTHEDGGLIEGEWEYIVLGWAYWNDHWAKAK